MPVQEKLDVSVKWGNKMILDPRIFLFDVLWLRRATVRELLVRVLEEVDPSLSLGDAETMYVNVVQDVEECSPFGETKKRHISKTNANRVLDDEIYDVMNNVPTRQFDFIVKPVDPAASRQSRRKHLVYAVPYFFMHFLGMLLWCYRAESMCHLLSCCRNAAINAFDFLRAAASRESLVLPPFRDTADNTADDILHGDILVWLHESNVGWPKDKVQTIGHDFVNRITKALFPLTASMFDAMSDEHNAGDRVLHVLYLFCCSG
jgi:hypothetical protein